MGEEAEREAEALAEGRRHFGDARRSDRARALAVGEAARAGRSRSGGISATSTPTTSSRPATAGGDDRQLDRVLAVQHPGPQQDPEDDQRDRVEGVVEGEEGDHPPGRRRGARIPALRSAQ